MSCVADQCRQGRVSCPTPATCFGAQNLHRVMHLPIEFAEDDPVLSTPEAAMTWSALAWTLTLAAALACVVMVAINWPVR